MSRHTLHKKMSIMGTPTRFPNALNVKSCPDIKDEEKKFLDLLAEILTSKIIEDAKNEPEPCSGGLYAHQHKGSK